MRTNSGHGRSTPDANVAGRVRLISTDLSSVMAVKWRKKVVRKTGRLYRERKGRTTDEMSEIGTERLVN